MDAVYLTAEEQKLLQCRLILALQKPEHPAFAEHPRTLPHMHLTADNIPEMQRMLFSESTKDFFVWYDYDMHWTEAQLTELNALTAKLRQYYNHAAEISSLPEMFQMQLFRILYGHSETRAYCQDCNAQTLCTAELACSVMGITRSFCRLHCWRILTSAALQYDVLCKKPVSQLNAEETVTLAAIAVCQNIRLTPL